MSAAGSIAHRAAVCAAMVSLIIAGLVGAAHALPSDSWVLAIGNNLGDADEIGLLYAEDDAKAMADVLHALSGVPSGHITTLLGEKADGVRSALADLEARIARETDGGPSAVVVYYSGHSDAQALHLDGTRLPLRELVDTVESMGAKTRLLILDACRSGGASRVKGVRATQSFALDFVEQSAVEGLAVITSSTARESSLESDRLRGSFFTHYFVGALRGAADEDGDGRVTLSEAYDHAYAETVRASGRTATLQHPTFSMDMKGKGAVVLSRPSSGRNLGRVALPDRSLYLISDGNDGRLVAEVKPQRPGTRVALPARRYRVQQRARDEYREYVVDLKPGKVLALNGQPYRSVRYDRLVRKRGGDKLYVHGLSLLGGARSALLVGEGPAPTLALGYGLDFPWFSAGLRLRLEQVHDDGIDLPRTRSTAAIGLTVERFTDLSWASASFGLRADVGWYQQTFDSPRDVPGEATIGVTFSGLLALERALYGGLSVRLEGGPGTTVLPVTEVRDGAPLEDQVEARLVYWTNLGVVWRL